MSSVSSVIVAIALMGIACSSSSGVGDDAGVPDAGVTDNDVRFVGDSDLAPEGELIVYEASSSPPRSYVHTEATPIKLQFGLQGGFMVLVAARVRNMDIGTLQITGTASDECFAPARAIGRTSNPMFAQEVDGWGVPDPVQGTASYLNLQLCPNLDSTRDADGHPYDLTVRVTDRARRTLELSTRFTATCAGADGPGQEACECQCDDQSTLGEECAVLDLSDVTDPEPGQCPD
jgi:hypothetical protein